VRPDELLERGDRVGPWLVGSTAAPGRAHEARDTGLFLLWQTDPEVEAEGLGDLLPEPRADGATGHPPDHLAHEVAVGHRVVAVRGAGLPVGCLCRERVRHRRPWERLLERERRVAPREPRLVGEQLLDRDLTLAGLG